MEDEDKIGEIDTTPLGPLFEKAGEADFINYSLIWFRGTKTGNTQGFEKIKHLNTYITDINIQEDSTISDVEPFFIGVAESEHKFSLSLDFYKCPNIRDVGFLLSNTRTVVTENCPDDSFIGVTFSECGNIGDLRPF